MIWTSRKGAVKRDCLNEKKMWAEKRSEGREWKGFFSISNTTRKNILSLKNYKKREECESEKHKSRRQTQEQQPENNTGREWGCGWKGKFLMHEDFLALIASQKRTAAPASTTHKKKVEWNENRNENERKIFTHSRRRWMQSEVAKGGACSSRWEKLKAWFTVHTPTLSSSSSSLQSKSKSEMCFQTIQACRKYLKNFYSKLWKWKKRKKKVFCTLSSRISLPSHTELTTQHIKSEHRQDVDDDDDDEYL